MNDLTLLWDCAKVMPVILQCLSFLKSNYYVLAFFCKAVKMCGVSSGFWLFCGNYLHLFALDAFHKKGNNHCVVTFTRPFWSGEKNSSLFL